MYKIVGLLGGDDDFIQKVAVSDGVDLVANLEQVYVGMIEHDFAPRDVSIQHLEERINSTQVNI